MLARPWKGKGAAVCEESISSSCDESTPPRKLHRLSTDSSDKDDSSSPDTSDFEPIIDRVRVYNIEASLSGWIPDGKVIFYNLGLLVESAILDERLNNSS